MTNSSNIIGYEEWKSLNESESYIPGVSDIEIIAATLIGEAGGEGETGMRAVKSVLQNRANKKGTGPAREAVRPRKFSMWDSATTGVSVRTDFDPAKISKVIDKYRGHSKWNLAIELSKSDIKDITNGATHYYASGGSQQIKAPYWARDEKWKETAVIGNHTFGKRT